jgi:hypothetical protein
MIRFPKINKPLIRRKIDLALKEKLEVESACP